MSMEDYSIIHADLEEAVMLMRRMAMGLSPSASFELRKLAVRIETASRSLDLLMHQVEASHRSE